MKFILGLIAFIAFGYGVLLIPEATAVLADTRATVWQQISLRLAIGLSLTVFVLAAGLAAICHGIDELRNDLAKRHLPTPAPAPHPASVEPVKVSSGEQGFTGKTNAERRREALAATMGVTLPSDAEMAQGPTTPSSGPIQQPTTAAAEPNAPEDRTKVRGFWVNR